MTFYGDLDVSVIDEMPPGRKPIQTLLIGEGKRPQLYNFMKKEIAAGRQVFVVYPLIFESERLTIRTLKLVMRISSPDSRFRLTRSPSCTDNRPARSNSSTWMLSRRGVRISLCPRP